MQTVWHRGCIHASRPGVPGSMLGTHKNCTNEFSSIAPLEVLDKDYIIEPEQSKNLYRVFKIGKEIIGSNFQLIPWPYNYNGLELELQVVLATFGARFDQRIVYRPLMALLIPIKPNWMGVTRNLNLQGSISRFGFNQPQPRLISRLMGNHDWLNFLQRKLLKIHLLLESNLVVAKKTKTGFQKAVHRTEFFFDNWGVIGAEWQHWSLMLSGLSRFFGLFNSLAFLSLERTEVVVQRFARLAQTNMLQV